MAFSLKQIRYFVAAADTGQVSQAAVDLNVSQSAVTAAIKQLEADLQTRLFDRHSNGVTLSYQGHRFLQHARNILSAVDEAARASQDARSDVAGSLLLGVTYTVAGYFLPSPLNRFQRSFPGVEVALREAPRSEIEQALIAGDLDLAVVLTSNLENVEHLVSETLIRSRRHLWLPLDHPLLHAERITLKEVAAEPYIMLTVDEAAHTAQRYWELTPHRPRVTFRTSSVEAVRSMVAGGMGVTVLSDMVYRPWSLEGQRIETRGLEDHVPSMDVGIAWRRGARLPPAARAFLDYMSRTFNGAGSRVGD
ncbi:DNA-binding transcriptional regulator, LysR family [Tistlia consotensis]|uniref:DNA-binding transcriptional regulator, LysR family n=1 Tax=Tistlia consotensis USBA 355 TaxID=560819 RepID=A0A1Y6CCY9_9PROT|nr:LysR family transcriptional regulator [Tistlia consotensis]SMF56600.1 DNA-binding transcriptional regulator, LysR family [Tistlia consotensis USBA 355]SNR44796.1 DNA-binding transcriptional regulator, LysR family [Tistlia consotensis]